MKQDTQTPSVLALQHSVRMGYDMSGGSFTNMNLSGANLYFSRLSGSDFRCANLSNARLYGADLRGASFKFANLTGANLAGARLCGANFSHADLIRTDLIEAHGVVDAGIDPRGYRFVGVAQYDVSFRIAAGCRWFTYLEAVGHWQAKDNRDALDRVYLIANHFERAKPDNEPLPVRRG